MIVLSLCHPEVRCKVFCILQSCCMWKGTFCNCRWNTNHLFFSLFHQIPLWLDFGLVLQFLSSSCFLSWPCWQRQEHHIKSESEKWNNSSQPAKWQICFCAAPKQAATVLTSPWLSTFLFYSVLTNKCCLAMFQVTFVPSTCRRPVL